MENDQINIQQYENHKNIYFSFWKGLISLVILSIIDFIIFCLLNNIHFGRLNYSLEWYNSFIQNIEYYAYIFIIPFGYVVITIKNNILMYCYILCRINMIFIFLDYNKYKFICVLLLFHNVCALVWSYWCYKYIIYRLSNYI